MLHEALVAAEILRKADLKLKVVNMPWLNRVDPQWLRDILGPCNHVCVLDDHSPFGGLGDTILNALVNSGLLGSRSFKKFAVEGYPACGTPQEVLKYHGLDGASLAGRLRAARG
jgi:transketolase